LLSLSQSAKLEGKVTTVVVQTASQSGNAEGLAGCAPNEEVDLSIFVFLNSREVAVQWHVWVSVFKHGARELFNLGKECSLPAQVMPRGCRGLNATAY
jgi:hypothetical protein